MRRFSLSNLRRKFNSGLNRLGRKFELQRVPGIPMEIQLAPTNACNLRCKACPKTWYDTDNSHLSPEIYEKVKNEIFPHIRVLNIQGLGEPMLSPLFETIIDDATANDLKIRFVTNATRFNTRVLEKVFHADCDVTISLDGARAETHEDSRPGSDFSRIIEVLAEFQNLRSRHPNSSFHLAINTVVTRRNVDELEDILDIVIRHDCNGLSLINPGVGDRNDDYARDVIARHTQLLREKLPLLKARASQAGIFFQSPEGFEATNENESRPAETRLAQAPLFPGRCLDPWRTAYIDVDGWVRPCCRAIWIGMGNIMDTSFREIWNNSHYRKLRQSVNSDNPPDFCRNCTLWWGITKGNELYPEELKKRGIFLPPGPQIGFCESPGKDRG